MSETHIDKWFCCLNDAENTAVNLYAASVVGFLYYVDKAAFDAIFLLAIEGSASIRRQIFIDNWGMTEGTVPVEPGVDIPVYFVNGGWANEWFAYIAVTGGACPDGCEIREFSS